MSSQPIAESDSVSVAPVFSPTVSFLSRKQTAFCAVFLAVVGIFSIWPTALYLWQLWTIDALKSIGMVIPVVSGALILRAWRNLGYEMEGSWWGAVILVLTIAAVHFREQSVLVLILSPQWSIFL